jgi:hypothetical protein
MMHDFEHLKTDEKLKAPTFFVGAFIIIFSNQAACCDL